MKVTKPIFYLALLLATLKNNVLMSQSLPIGSVVFEEGLRRAQLTRKADSSSSFILRPTHPQETQNIQNSYYIQDLYSEDDSVTASLARLLFFGEKAKIMLLPASYQTQVNSQHPYGWNDGGMIPNRGYQHLISFGVFGKIGPLNIQVRPEWVFSENRVFEMFPGTFTQDVLAARRYHWETADPPERFGLTNYSKITLGQSSVYLNLGAFRLGVANENIWWGPGQFNSLIFSNNSRGFQHITLNSIRPIKTFIGTFESQVVAGKLSQQDFTPVYGNGYSAFRKSDWRYLSAAMITYSPKWVNGLFVGFARTFQQYSEDLVPSFAGYFPIFEAFQKKKVGLAVDDLNQDQTIAVYLRWLLLKSNAEVYLELARRDHALNWRDFMMSPEHARAFLFGFSKNFFFRNDDGIQVRFELTQTQQSINHLLRYSEEGGGQSWGAHLPIRSGFTHYGQQLGNGVGPGNNAQTLEIAWVKDIRKLGIMFERVENQMDFFNRAFRDGSPARPWVDISTGLVGNWRFNRLVANAKIQFIKSLNYQWQQDFIYPGGQNARGVDRFNLHSYMGVTYLF